MTKSTPQRAPRASKAKPVVRQRKNRPPTQDAAFVKVDVTPEQFFQSWSREEKEALVDILIHSFDEADGYSTTEFEGDDADPSDAMLRAHANPAPGDHEDDEPCLGTTEHLNQTNAGLYGRDGWTTPTDLELDDSDMEPSLAACERAPTVPLSGWFGAGERRDDGGSQLGWAAGAMDDREGDPGCDDKEPSLCGIHADSGYSGSSSDQELDDSDLEPSLGWTAEEAAYGRVCAGTMGRCFDLEEDAGSERECDPAEMGVGDMDGLKEQCAGYGAVC
jgi:hypothetical protein